MKILKQKEDFKLDPPMEFHQEIFQQSCGHQMDAWLARSGRWQILVDFCHNDRARVCSNCMSCSGVKK